ncbi:MAG: hypothetical protein EBS66_10645 [Betaproteobacteria bacterium]|nr:hypothetical protein [Betaproteobacteria bacterium]
MTTSEARKRREDLAESMRDQHRWELHLSSVGRDRVICNHCGKVFMPGNEVIPYTGPIPGKFA